MKRSRSPAQYLKPVTDTRAARRKAKREETARIRDERMSIAGGQCEAMDLRWRGGRCVLREGLVMHHLKGGSGRRREKQTVDTVRILCAAHHAEAHRKGRYGK